jgi:hypothetical protein
MAPARVAPDRTHPPQEAGERIEEVPEYDCEDCGLPFKNAQGLTGHRRLKHSTSTARQLDEHRQALEQRQQALTTRERAAQQKAADAARAAEAVRGKEAELAGREALVEEAEATPETDRIRRVVREQIESLREVTTDTILRVDGTDFRFSDTGDLVHLYWPKGEKTEFAEGEPFQHGGRAYCIRHGRLEAVRSATLLAKVLGEED